MISTLLTLVLGIYAGLFLAKSGISLDLALAPLRSAIRACRGKGEEDNPKPVKRKPRKKRDRA